MPTSRTRKPTPRTPRAPRARSARHTPARSFLQRATIVHVRPDATATIRMGSTVHSAICALPMTDLFPGDAVFVASESADRYVVIARVASPRPVRAILDTERRVISADREVVLQCGKASITLTRAGKVIIRGEYVLTRSAGVNRIKGASVQIN